MKQCSIAIAVCMLVAGCERASRSITGPGAPDIGLPAAFYTLAGRILNVEGHPLQYASLELTGDIATQTALSDANGEYRFGDVRGHVMLRVSKGDDIASESLWVDRDITLDVRLGRMVLRPGATLKGRVDGPPCDPARWDASAPCRPVYFVPPTNGPYELLLTWDGTKGELDMRIDGGLYFGVTNNPNQIRATITGTASVQNEIQIHSYYAPQDFELTATPK